MNIEERNKLYKQYSNIVPYLLRTWNFKTKELEEDCYQEARLILLRAIEKYDKYKNKMSIMNYLCKSVKWKMCGKYPKLKNIINQPSELNRCYGYKKLFNEYKGIPPREVINRNNLKEWVFEYMDIEANKGITFSYNSEKDSRQENSNSKVEEKIDADLFYKKFSSTLNSRELLIINKLYLDPDDRKSMPKLAKDLDVSVARIDQIKKRALNKIRAKLQYRNK